MFMVIPHWDIAAELPAQSSENRPGKVRLTVNDNDLEAVFRSLRASGYVDFTMNKSDPFLMQQTVEE